MVLGHCTDTEKLVSCVALLSYLAHVVSEVQNIKRAEVFLLLLAPAGPGYGVPPAGPGFGGYPQPPAQSYAGGGPAQIPGMSYIRSIQG